MPLPVLLWLWLLDRAGDPPRAGEVGVLLGLLDRAGPGLVLRTGDLPRAGEAGVLLWLLDRAAPGLVLRTGGLPRAGEDEDRPPVLL